MSKYLHVVNIGIQNNLTYRFNFLARALFGLIPLIAILYVWHAIYAGGEPLYSSLLPLDRNLTSKGFSAVFRYV